MLKVIKNLLKANRLYIAILNTVVITFLSLTSLKLNTDAISFSNLDKLEHAFAYFVFACSWLYAFPQAINSRKKRIYISIAVFLYGILMEGFQMQFTNYRQGDFFDIIANTTGVVFAFISFKWFLEKITFFYENRFA